MRTSAAFALVSALALGTAGVGCSNDSDEPATLTDGTVRIATEGQVALDVKSAAPIKLGKNTVFVTFPTQPGSLSSASALMPAHGHGSPPATIEREGDAFVIRDIVLYMSGRWEIHLALKIDDRDDEAIVAVDVP